MRDDKNYVEAVQARRATSGKLGRAGTTRRWNKKWPKDRVAYKRGQKQSSKKQFPGPEHVETTT